MTPEEFRRAGHELIDWVADHRTRLERLPVRATTAPGEVTSAFPAHAPGWPQSFSELLTTLEEVVVPGLTQTQHPSFFGWFPCNASLSSVLGEVAAGGLAGLGITWESGPAVTEVEEVVTEWLRQLTGLPPGWRGAIHDTASTTCLTAMLLARERASSFSQNHGGLQDAGAALTVYTSTQAHSSVVKGALLAGFGRDNIRWIDVDPATYAMRPEALRAALAEDAAVGKWPAIVIPTIGTTATTAIDPLPAVVEAATPYGAWIHVDAAMAGSGLILPELHHLIDGIDGADSLGWNAHKWLGTVMDCALLYVKDPSHLVRVMSTDPSYLRSSLADQDVTQFKDWGIPLGRRFRSLKLLFHLHLDGVEAIRERLRRDVANARWFADLVSQSTDWTVLAPVTLQTVCLRHEPPSLTRSRNRSDELDRHTLAWADAVNRSGLGFVTPAQLDGRWMVRVSIGAENTEREHVEELWRTMQAAVAAAMSAGSAVDGR